MSILRPMPKVALHTVGCRLNQYETDRIASEFVSRGFEHVAYTDPADVYVLNTCTVTARADADSRKLIKRALRINPDAVMVVTGCFVASGSDQITAIEGVDLLIDNKEKMRLAEIVVEQYPELGGKIIATNSEACFRKEMYESGAAPDRYRPLVKIGDGCSQHCSYCIVPRVRGALVSYPADQIVGEVAQLAAAGYQEVVITAVHIGKYRHKDISLGGLVRMILDKTDIGRVRLSSLEPNELDDMLLEMVAGNPRVCRHLHLPLQSGADRILKLMRRPYRQRDFINVVERIKTANSAITIGSDVIVGFPGETEADFGETVDIMDSGLVDYGHIFSYSDRPGTAASEIDEKVDIPVIRDRNKRLREICDVQRRRQAKARVGSVLRVISQPEASDGYYWGMSDNYFRVKLDRASGGGRQIIPVRIEGVDGADLVGVAEASI